MSVQGSDGTTSKASTHFGWMLLPFISLMVIGAAIFIERIGFIADPVDPDLEFLPALTSTNQVENNQIATCLILVDTVSKAGTGNSATIRSALSDANVACDVIDVRNKTQIDFSPYKNIVVTFVDLDLIKNQINPLFAHVEAGNSLLFSIRPDPGHTFQAVYRKMGIQNKADRVSNIIGAKFLSPVLIGAESSLSTFTFLNHSSIPVQLDPLAKVYMTSADEFELPILWKWHHGKGSVVVINSDQFNDLSSSGILLAAYGLSNQAMIYPVINSWVIYLDNFPGPLTNNITKNIQEQFGRDDRSFITNVWWPDINSLAVKYNAKLTGLMVGSYAEKPTFPYPVEGEVEDFRFLASSLLENGGELGIKGYNNDPICAELSTKPQNNAKLQSTGVPAFLKFSDQLLGGKDHIRTIGPVRGDECGQIESLADISEDLRVLALDFDPVPTEGLVNSHFNEYSSGMVTVPVITTNYGQTNYELWSTINLLTTKFVHTNRINPNQVLVDATTDWPTLRAELDQKMLWIRAYAKGIRPTTAAEAAMAVQRYARASGVAAISGGSLSLKIDPFIDQGMYILFVENEPAAISGGSIEVIDAFHYLIRPTQSEVIIHFSELP